MAELPLFRGRRPTELAFGTSGLRGLVTDITDLEAYVNTRGFLAYLFEREPGAPRQVALGGDLRPSTDGKERSIMRAVAQAASDAGVEVIHAGKLPSPALAHFAFQHGIASIMVTGSHIPFDRNGIKFNMPDREVLKTDEAGILAAVALARARAYAEAPEVSPFDDAGMLRPGRVQPLSEVDPSARELYVRRYLEFFPERALEGLSVAVYQHSAVGRDLVVEVLVALGAQVYPAGRSEDFVAIDTEAIDAERLAVLEGLHREVRARHGAIDAIVSTDGDSDRPLLLGVTASGELQFVGGDVLGILVADYLGADALAVPVSATDAIDQAFAKRAELLRTRIGSPWVIAAMQQLGGQRRVGWEANGGFMVGSAIERKGRRLAPLATRDALLPILGALHAAKLARKTLVELFDALPRRYAGACLIDVERPAGELLASYLVPQLPSLVEVRFAAAGPSWRDESGVEHGCIPEQAEQCEVVRERLARQFSRELGFQAIERVDFRDGIRCYFAGGDVAHLRASGNAPQLRMYAVSDTAERTRRIIDEAVRPQGMLERFVADASEHEFVSRVLASIAHTNRLFAEGQPPSLIGTVSGAASAQRFWQQALDAMKPAFRAETAISLFEDLPTNQAFGLLLMWQRLREHWRPGKGALLAFVFGEGSRATPFTETDNGQKPAIASFVRSDPSQSRAFQSMVALAMRCFAPVEAYLRRSGFDGVVVKWGDEVQIPVLDLSGTDPLFADADIVRFVSLRTICDEDAREKDWVGVDSTGHVTAFIPRRPLAEMRVLAERGLLLVRGTDLVGGINLGSIAVSRVLLDALLAEFSNEVNDADANRKERPDLDPQFFTVLMLALIDDAQEREGAYQESIREVPALAKLSQSFPDLLRRLCQVVASFRERHGKKPRVVALNFGDQYWGDVGLHRQIYRFYMALGEDSADGRIARALAGLESKRDARGNWLSGQTRVAPEVRVENSVLIDCELSGSGSVDHSVLIGTRAGQIRASHAFDVLSTVTELVLEPGAGSYKVVSLGPVHVASQERVTSLFLPGREDALFKATEDLDLRDRVRNYETAVLGNPLSFSEAHALMLETPVDELSARRAQKSAEVTARLDKVRR